MVFTLSPSSHYKLHVNRTVIKPHSCAIHMRFQCSAIWAYSLWLGLKLHQRSAGTIFGAAPQPSRMVVCTMRSSVGKPHCICDPFGALFTLYWHPQQIANIVHLQCGEGNTQGSINRNTSCCGRVDFWIQWELSRTYKPPFPWRISFGQTLWDLLWIINQY